jgi:glyoxylase-like metal-dependent hydrolase (beta-lactamase superfamily II)
MRYTRIARALLLTSALTAQVQEKGTLPEHWPTGGPNCMEMQEYYVHEYNPSFYILRQSGCTDYEKPFLYLIFGTDKAMLWDTGSRNSRVREAVDRLIVRWLKENKRESIPLIVMHSHKHGDHIAGDAQFADRPDTTLVKPDLASVKAFFGFQNWPEEVRAFDLGGRPMDLVPIPGHTDDSFALYDRRTGVLLTGDTVYPGRLYVSDLDAFKASIHRLALFTADKPIAQVLGNHIEQTTTPFVDYPTGTKYQPEEHELALSAGHILELDRALQALKEPKSVLLRDMTISIRAPRAR